MKKKFHSIAACGLGCALALSMSPAAAFAADMDGTGVEQGDQAITDLSSDSDATTDVKVFGTDSQISVTVPVGLTVAVSGAPGATFAGAPTNYAIENNSYFDVQVKKVAASDTDTNWDYSDAKVTTATSVTNGKTGAIHIDLFPTIASPTGTTGAVAITKAGVNTASGATASKWKISAKKNVDDASSLAIGINGTTKLDTGLDSDSTAAAKAATLTYTIGRA